MPLLRGKSRGAPQQLSEGPSQGQPWIRLGNPLPLQPLQTAIEAKVQSFRPGRSGSRVLTQEVLAEGEDLVPLPFLEGDLQQPAQILPTGARLPLPGMDLDRGVEVIPGLFEPPLSQVDAAQ